MDQDEGRIFGWKAIGSYFGRDRSTAIRWANERNLPVHRVPGGKTASVYALRDELDEWATSHDTPAEPDAVETGAKRRRLTSPLMLVLVGTAVVGVAATAGKLLNDRLPSNPETAERFLAARDDWARSDTASLERAIAGYQAVLARDPGFAKAHAGLADAYLMAGEYGSLSYDIAFGRAKHSAVRALELDPGLAMAHRDLAYIGYWWERDPVAAGKQFRKAIELAPDDWRAHFWYAGALADNGEFAPARREYTAARLGHPGSDAIETHLALGKWREGDTAGGIKGLEAVAAREPRDALSRYFLAIAYAGEGDFVRYLRIMQERGRLRGEPQQSANLKALDAALRSGGEPALKALVIDQANAEEANRPFTDHSLPAFLASAAGDRARLVATLRLADRSREVWGSAGYVLRIKQRWGADRDIIALLNRRASPAVEPLG